jgi:hypothetical protein
MPHRPPLDLQEPDPELEPNGDEEPSLGWPNPDGRAGHASQHRLYPEERDGDGEPSLGWSDMEARYGKYDYLARQGLEEEHDGSEPSLGWQNTGSQTRLYTSRDDCEEQCEDEGAQDDREPDVDVEPEGLPIPGGQGL